MLPQLVLSPRYCLGVAEHRLLKSACAFSIIELDSLQVIGAGTAVEKPKIR
jgi:hypothetical protein